MSSQSTYQPPAKAEPYEHKPLSSTDSFRLFDLFPSKDTEAIITGSLREVETNLGLMPAYEALSYVWHAEPGTGVVSVDGLTLSVTTNCLKALKALRLKRKLRPLWVDSICIDQREDDRSIKERNNQVIIMGFIYGSATTVISWLGPSVTGMQRLAKIVAALDTLDDICTRKSVSAQISRPAWLQMRKSLLCKPYTIPSDTTRTNIRQVIVRHRPVKKAMTNILENPWWSRAWTLQEHILAKKWTLLCGHVTMSDIPFITAVGHMLERSQADCFQPWFMRLRISTGFHRQKFRDNISDLTDSLVGIPFYLRTLKSVDRIYSLYTILTLLEIDLPVPDYRKSVNQVYEETIVALIRTRLNLGLIIFATRPPDTSDLPSWVPDWRQEESYLINTLIAFGTRRNDTGKACSPGETAWIDHQPNVLRTHGRCLGTMEYSKFAGPEILDSLMFIDTCQDWCRQVRRKVTSYPTGEDIEVALFKTLLFPWHDALESVRQEVLAFLEWMDLMLYPQSRNPSWASLSQKMSWNESNFILKFMTMAKYMGGPRAEITEMVHRWIFLSTRFHSFSILDSGYMCLNLLLSRPGDQVFLVPGSNWPLVLRPEGDSYRFVGPAYVHGVMEGEGWEKAEPLREIRLI